MAKDNDKPGLALPERLIPTPTTVSPEAQAFLSRGLGVMPPEIPHTDKDAYRAYVEQVEGFMRPIAQQRAEPFPAAIAEHSLTNSTLYEVTPESLKPDNDDKAILHIHGGAFIVGGGMTAAYTAQTYASLTGIRAWSVDYRMPPDHPYPNGLDDCVEAYAWLVKRFDPAKIALEGSSAGANLVAATILRASDEGLPVPGACSLHTAGVDMTHSGDTFATNEVIDVVLRKGQPETMLLYADGHDMAHPYLSPVFGDLGKGFPPTILVSGTRDMLLSPTVMMHRALRRAGIEAELHVFEAMPHGGLSGASPEDQELQAEIANFISGKLG
ncbi:MAG: alpha/beta hydrolase [Novosphingobium sp.]|nr:alpha/beta hydrolase [Novosphingobium sp.]